jgi:hypothetical protein
VHNTDRPGPPAHCTSCGAEDGALALVHRQYPVLDGDRVVLGPIQDEIEWWCPACRLTYPGVPGTEPGVPRTDPP